MKNAGIWADGAHMQETRDWGSEQQITWRGLRKREMLLGRLRRSKKLGGPNGSKTCEVLGMWNEWSFLHQLWVAEVWGISGGIALTEREQMVPEED